MMDYKLQDKMNPFLTELLLAMVYHHINRKAKSGSKGIVNPISERQKSSFILFLCIQQDMLYLYFVVL